MSATRLVYLAGGSSVAIPQVVGPLLCGKGAVINNKSRLNPTYGMCICVFIQEVVCLSLEHMSELQNRNKLYSRQRRNPWRWPPFCAGKVKSSTTNPDLTRFAGCVVASPHQKFLVRFRGRGTPKTVQCRD